MASTLPPPTLVLHVGHDFMLLHTRSLVLRSAGYIVKCEYTVEDAIRHFLSADFDLVLLCHSLSEEERQRFIHRVRERGSSTPVLSVDLSCTSNTQGTADNPRIGNDPIALLKRLGETLQKDRAAHNIQRH